jgi:hypothetical protein
VTSRRFIETRAWSATPSSSALRALMSRIAGVVRAFLSRPSGMGLGLCACTTRQLGGLGCRCHLNDDALAVRSPGRCDRMKALPLRGQACALETRWCRRGRLSRSTDRRVRPKRRLSRTEWREPDSNRRDHDFQRRPKGRRKRSIHGMRARLAGSVSARGFQGFGCRLGSGQGC